MSKKTSAQFIAALAEKDRHREHAALLHAVVTDEHAGRGGTYLFDPATGKRRPADQPPTDQET